ncbi:FAD-dependent oxidoreductase [Maribellus luteus]|uniref:FAD-dependent oxidoreductase n=1 Tax=Maribellus luteus TaxID=2305463 RepID=A0A399T748_9BACT|nr:FAD-dependent oxidoreductase [Maribellus luteus]RIJ49997.1 FAD-dependent oxidoreductase [Maribellus luteus]
MKLVQTLTILTLFILIALTSCKNTNREGQFSADVVIYGGTSAGISAAIQTERSGKSVILIEPTNRLGGLTTGGLGQTDIGNKQVIGGIAREFYQNIKTHYEDSSSWIWQMKCEYRDGGQTRTNKNEDAMWTFEPSAALNVYHNMIKGLDIHIVYNQQLNRSTGVLKTGNTIESITMESGETYLGKVFIDATYEGDLMASAGVSYAVGRESNSKYGESLNGVQSSDTSRTFTGVLSINARNHNLVKGVDPYIIPGDASSGLLPGINPSIENDGNGDRKVQAYCFRMCLTDHPENRIPFIKPADYNEQAYELLFRNYEAGFNRMPWINSSMPNRKTDTNNKHGVSTDFIGGNYSYPDASYSERKEIVAAHKSYQQGLMWTLAYHPRIPKDIRDHISQFGTCKDEFENKDGWQQQLYIREARRMVGELMMTQKHCEGIQTVSDGIGMAAYGMDSHNTQRYVTPEGFVSNEGNVEAHVKAPFPISYRSVIPKKEECSNLLVPVCLSATHIAFGSIRMEPVFMVLGQSTAVIASLAIDNNKGVQKVEYNEIKNKLIKLGQVLD